MKALQAPKVVMEDEIGFTLTTDALNAKEIDNIGAQLVWSSTGESVVKVQVSNDYVDAERPPAPVWSDYVADVSTIAQPSGSTGSSAFKIGQIPFPWFRFVSTPANPAEEASAIIQDLTYTAVDPGTAGNNIKIQYVSGGTTGAETVRVDGLVITVTFHSGASTATQIKTAVDASAAAMALVGVTVSGTGSNTQAATGIHSLASGAAAVAASRVIQDITYTAVTAGTAGNSITITYTNTVTAGSEVASAVGSAITVTIQSGVSTATQVRTAVLAAPAVVALVSSAITGTGSNAQTAVGATNLQSGAAAVAASRVEQDLTYAAVTAGTGGNSITLQYWNDPDVVAGNEVVAVNGNAIVVGIRSGVSTATQIRTKVLASGPAAALVGVTVSGTGSNAQTASATTSLSTGTQEAGTLKIMISGKSLGS